MAEAASRTFGADITKCCHHGSADFTDAFIRAVNPYAIVISSGDEESHAHPRLDTLGAIGLYGRGWRPLIFSTELARSTREQEPKSLVEEIGRIRGKLETITNPSKQKELEERKKELVDRLLTRNVTVYGSINLRSDGEKTIVAYKLEQERKIGNSLTKWDIYSLEKAGTGPICYVGS